MSKRVLEWVMGSQSQFDFYTLESRLEADFGVSIVVAEPWEFFSRDDGEPYGAIVVGAIDLDAAGYPMVAASAVGVAPFAAGVCDAHEAALNALRALEDRLANTPIPFLPADPV